MALRDDFELANQRAKDLEGSVPRVVTAHYDRKAGRVVMQLSSKLIVSFSPGDVEGLEDAKASQLSEIEISPSGFGIHFPAADADLYVPALLGRHSGLKEVDGVQVGSDWRPIQEQGKKGGFQGKWKAGRKAQEGRRTAGPEGRQSGASRGQLTRVVSVCWGRDLPGLTSRNAPSPLFPSGRRCGRRSGPRFPAPSSAVNV